MLDQLDRQAPRPRRIPNAAGLGFTVNGHANGLGDTGHGEGDGTDGSGTGDGGERP